MSQGAPVQPVYPCSQCGRAFPHSELVPIAGNWVCADCKPAYLSRVMASGVAGTSPQGWHYGGFWIRFGARIIDGLVLGVPLVIVFFLFIPGLLKAQTDPANPNFGAFAAVFLSILVVSFAISAAYEIGMLKYRGATLGKMACGLKVVRANGSDLGWGVCVGRYAMWNIVTSGIPYLNTVLMLVSSIMAGTDAEKRALHDRVCDTRVIYK